MGRTRETPDGGAEAAYEPPFPDALRCRCKIRLSRELSWPSEARTADPVVELRCQLAVMHQGLHVASGRGLPIYEDYSPATRREDAFSVPDSIYSVSWRAFQ